MTAATLTLTEFLLARIAEDEAWANAAIETPGATHWHWVRSETDEPVTPDPFTQGHVTEDGDVSLRSVEELKPAWEGAAPLPDFVIWAVDDVLTPGAAGHIARHDPARVLAECEAKRRVVQRQSDILSSPDIYDRSAMINAQEVLEALGAVYGDHPDYRDEWLP